MQTTFNFTIKGLFRLISIISDIITVALFLSVLTGWKMNNILCNPYFKFLVFSVLFTGLVYAIPYLNKKIIKSGWRIASITLIVVAACSIIFFLPKSKCTTAPVLSNTDSAGLRPISIIHDTLMRHDTTIIYPNYSDKGSTKHIAVHKKAGSQSGNTQIIDSGGSGIQNNAPNYGNQAGRDMYLNAEKKLTDEELIMVIKEINRLSAVSNIKCIGYILGQGSNGGEVVYQIKQAVAVAGYDPENSMMGADMSNWEGLKISVHMNCITVFIGHFH